MKALAIMTAIILCITLTGCTKKSGKEIEERYPNLAAIERRD